MTIRQPPNRAQIPSVVDGNRASDVRIFRQSQVVGLLGHIFFIAMHRQGRPSILTRIRFEPFAIVRCLMPPGARPRSLPPKTLLRGRFSQPMFGPQGCQRLPMNGRTSHVRPRKNHPP